MYRLNEKIRDLTPYDPIQGSFAVRLDANESFLLPPEEVRSRLLEKAAQVAWNRYPDATCRELRESFGAFYGVDPERVTPGDGSDELLSILANAFLMAGETLVTAEPDFSMYRFYASVSGARVASYSKGEDLAIDPDAFIAFIREQNPRMVLFSNPCNPTSLGLSREDVRRIIRSTEALVVVDEAYMDFWDQSLLSEVERYDNLLILRTCSKALGMASLRLGFAVGNATLTKALWAVKSPYNVNSFSQTMGAAVLRETRWAREALEQILLSRDTLVKELKALEKRFPKAISCLDSHTNFAFLRVENAESVFRALCEAGVAVRRMGGYLRVTAGSREENETFLRAFERILESSASQG